MRLLKTASGKKTIKMSKSEWTAIGKEAGWVNKISQQQPQQQQPQQQPLAMQKGEQQRQNYQQPDQQDQLNAREIFVVRLYNRVFGSMIQESKNELDRIGGMDQLAANIASIPMNFMEMLQSPEVVTILQNFDPKVKLQITKWIFAGVSRGL